MKKFLKILFRVVLLCLLVIMVVRYMDRDEISHLCIRVIDAAQDKSSMENVRMRLERLIEDPSIYLGLDDLEKKTITVFPSGTDERYNGIELKPATLGYWDFTDLWYVYYFKDTVEVDNERRRLINFSSDMVVSIGMKAANVELRFFLDNEDDLKIKVLCADHRDATPVVYPITWGKEKQ